MRWVGEFACECVGIYWQNIRPARNWRTHLGALCDSLAGAPLPREEGIGGAAEHGRDTEGLGVVLVEAPVQEREGHVGRGPRHQHVGVDVPLAVPPDDVDVYRVQLTRQLVNQLIGS